MRHRTCFGSCSVRRLSRVVCHGRIACGDGASRKMNFREGRSLASSKLSAVLRLQLYDDGLRTHRTAKCSEGGTGV
eukprot:6069546-Amphidinium_carterae.1